MTEFEELYVQYFEDVRRYVFSLCKNEAEAEEITQNTFFRALQSIDNYRGECKIFVWLCQIAKNLYFTSVKKQKRFVSEAELPEKATGDSYPEADVLSKELILQTHRALHRMDEPYKEVLMLRMFGELPFSRIADLFGKTDSWARVTYHRGKMKLLEALENEHFM